MVKYCIVRGFYFYEDKEAYKQAQILGHGTGYQMDCFGTLVEVPFKVWASRFYFRTDGVDYNNLLEY